MAMRYTIPLSYNPIDIPKLTEVLARYKDVHHNQMIIDFEAALQKTTGSTHVVALNSGTAAIHLALKVLGIGPGDLVIVPTFTYVATVNPIRYLGAEPVFIDSEPETWNMDPILLEKAIEDLKGKNKVPKAIMVVHTYGMPSKMNDILQLADRHGIPVIEDAAESLGSTYKGSHVGTLGAMGIYSFNNNKVVTTYGGGAITLKSAKLAHKVRFYASQAREQLPYYEHQEVGYNYAMSPLCAAAGLSQLPQLSQNIEERRRIFQRYSNEFSGLNIKGQPESDDNYSNRWFSAFTFKDEATRIHVSAILAKEGIETRPLWRPMHQQPVFERFKYFGNEVSDRLFVAGLCLPSGRSSRADEVKRIADLIHNALKTG